jgi:hypothetical protein
MPAARSFDELMTPGGPRRARDNPADNYEFTGAADIRCRACGRTVVRVARGDSAGSWTDIAAEHDCPMMLPPDDWWKVVQATYRAYRDARPTSISWNALTSEEAAKWRDIAAAAVREYLERKGVPDAG